MVNIFKVLDYYSAQGLVDVTPISLPGYQPNLPILQHMYLKSKLNNKRQNELIPYNDCLYRNIYRYIKLNSIDLVYCCITIKMIMSMSEIKMECLTFMLNVGGVQPNLELMTQDMR